MLYMITGLPGAGKSLYTIHRVTSDPQLLNREVHYHGIPDLLLPWVKLADPKRWFDVPDGSVVVIDEAQKVFPLRSAGSHVPEHVSYFETHRHRGIDVVLVTQDASLVDAHIRKLTERHFVLKRPFGLDYAKVFEFHGIGDPGNSSDVKQAIQSRFQHPKELYGKYKSASIHAVKKRLPLKALMLPLLLTVVGVLGWLVYQNMFGSEKAAEKLVEKEAGKAGAKSAGSAGPAQRTLPRDLPSYVDMFTPRSADLPASAPIYDALVAAVKDFPRIAGCMKSTDRCWCYSQQGTKLDLRPQICHAFIAQGGFFDPYKEPRRSDSMMGAMPAASGQSSASPSLASAF